MKDTSGESRFSHPGSFGSIQRDHTSGGRCRSQFCCRSWELGIDMGVSENSVPLNPMVNDHYPYEKLLFHWEYYPNIFRQTHMFL